MTPLTISIGLSIQGSSLDQLLTKADNLLYEAKQSRRNRLICDR